MATRADASLIVAVTASVSDTSGSCHPAKYSLREVLGLFCSVSYFFFLSRKAIIFERKDRTEAFTIFIMKKLKLYSLFYLGIFMKIHLRHVELDFVRFAY